MEISNLLDKLKGSDKNKPIPFLALELTDEVVAAAVWQVEDGKTVIVSMGTPVEWDGDRADRDELVKAVDATISNAVEGFEIEPSEVIFGVSGNWAGTEGIQKEKLALLKAICKELELKPLGFVVVTDSLLRYLKMQEGTPATSILVQVSRDNITVSLVKLGKIIGSEAIGRSDDISADVEEGLSRLDDGGEFPSRMLVFNSMHSLEEEVQNLISYDWKSKFSFLHFPKIESLPKDVLLRSIAVAGGAEVAKAIGFDISESEPIEPVAAYLPKEEKELENVIPVTEANVESTVEDTEVMQDLLSAEELGFSAMDKKSKPDDQDTYKAPTPARITLTADEEEMQEISKPVEDREIVPIILCGKGPYKMTADLAKKVE